ncbi:PorV/PorQ family protein [Vicingus serpentipes]|uniref:PorV/PorQ family protein n=1 Tax=Vicingus serpentipes TaxID=1926625 RepID=A0A5C6S0A6_9FLAO|nr:PorV/PorQ family protein [Vicingus serpentipes]TXB67042.1 PorV/PorQ family protein [Vicingus serpentipes]
MKNMKLIVALFVAGVLSVANSYAGNEDRAGEAGASQLLINPWVRSAGFGGANTASAIGLEAMNLNVAGLAYTNKTELMFTHKNWLSGSETKINSFGLTQKLGEAGVLGISIMSMNFGDIDITTVDLPEGGVGTFSPSYLNFDIGYAKSFSDRISGGIVLRIVSESISNVTSRGVAFNAGVKYVTGENDRIKFGIALNNVGPTMKASGEGLTFTNTDINTNVSSTQERRTSAYQLPSLLNIGASYDFYLAATKDSSSNQIKADHRLTLAGNFTANSFTNDQYRLGLEYGFRNMFMLRAGYIIESTTWFDSAKRTTAYTGPSFGGSFVAPLGKGGATFGIHYAYEMTERFNGTHSIGVRLDL